jgi:nicotinate-nucleotide pyrophosphorylase (carboxylating)
MRLNRFMIRPLVEAGLREELNAGDTTGGFLVWDEDPVQTGQIYAKGNGVA